MNNLAPYIGAAAAVIVALGVLLFALEWVFDVKGPF